MRSRESCSLTCSCQSRLAINDVLDNVIDLVFKTLHPSPWGLLPLLTWLLRCSLCFLFPYLELSLVKWVRTQNLPTSYNYTYESDLMLNVPADRIKMTLITGIKRGVFSTVKFHSTDEHKLARLLETEHDFVKNWLRPNRQEFKLIYNRTHHYEPDFVVETDDCIYLVEIKEDDKLNDADVIAKKERAVKYCKVATNYNNANNGKPWKYVLIPSTIFKENTTVEMLFRTFVVEE